MKKQLLLLLFCFVAGLSVAQTHKITIIPQPQEISVKDGIFTFDSSKPLMVYCDQATKADLAEMFALKFTVPTGIEVKFTERPSEASVWFLLDPKIKGGSDAYTLEISNKKIVAQAPAYGGLFYGLQTILQLMPREIKSETKVEGVNWTVPCVSISDSPRFAWRGLMLDVSRHYFNKTEVMKYIDELAEYKMNIFHWHLCDDQGWRIQIDAYPRLTEIGAWRADRVGDWWSRERQRDGEKATYGGFYTKADIREVLEYARKRNVTVMPEIDVPGHSLEVLVAYPELACLNAPKTVGVGNKFYTEDENSLCVGNDKTFEFMEKVLTEIAELFPCEYIHIGADECFKGFWAKCPKCQARMKAEGLANVNELQSYFVKRMEKILKSKGKHLVGWDEIHEGGLAPDAVVMSWRGMQGGIDAAKQGHKVIMTPNNHCYLDLYQGEPTVEPTTYSMCRLSDSYKFEPVPEGVEPSMILGGQGNLWSESVPTFRHAEYMVWPRGWALAEVLWTPKEKKNWDDFLTRTEEHFQRADIADINYSVSVYNAIVTPYRTSKEATAEVRIELASEIKGMKIYYTFDGTNPDLHSPLYTEPLKIPLNATRLRVVTYRDGKPAGKLISIEVSELLTRAKNNRRVVGNL